MVDPHDLPGVKQRDIQKCVGCGEGVAHDRNLVFYIADLRYMVLDPGALQRQHGMELMMGGPQMAGLAAVMGPDEDMAKQLERATAWVCLPCAMLHPLAVLTEKLFRDDTSPKQGE